MDELAMHPTVKPVAMVADAVKDCSKRGSLVLDPFCGSGTISSLPKGPAAEHGQLSLTQSMSMCDPTLESTQVRSRSSPRWVRL